MEKKIELNLDDAEELELIGKALASQNRIRILKLLCSHRLSIAEIADRLGIPASSAAMNVRVLEDAGLIDTEVQNGVRGSAKLCGKAVGSLELTIGSEDAGENTELVSMPIGNYVDYHVEPTCGLVSERGPIDAEDEPGAFYNPERSNAKLLWLGNGYVEYRFPNHMLIGKQIRKIEISAELCSEDHEYNLDCPSDITLWINGKAAGTWTCPSDYGGRRGKLNPDWWPDKNTQYGELKTWKINRRGTYLDNVRVSDMTLSDYGLSEGGYIAVRIGIDENAQNKGGINLFGDAFGDYRQDINLKITYM